MEPEQPEPQRSELSALAEDLDLSKYDVRSIAADLTEVANLPNAVASTAGRTALVPIAVAVVTWVIFSGRMSNLVLVLFVIVATLLSLGAAAVFAVAVLTRRQVNACTDASQRILGVVSEMHGDLAALRSGAAQLTVRSTATTLSNDVVFPMLEEMGMGVAGTFFRGPLRAIAAPVIGVPLGVVRKSVASAIGALPVDALDASIDLNHDPEMGTGSQLDAVAGTVTELERHYQEIQTSIEGLVKRTMSRSLVPVLATLLLTAVPLMLWWLAGWLLS